MTILDGIKIVLDENKQGLPVEEIYNRMVNRKNERSGKLKAFSYRMKRRY
jgi:hypothetical protein